jgi:hypothetical protein
MILYLEDPKDCNRKLIDLINKLRKVSVYRINIQNSVAFLQPSNKLAEKEIRKTVPFMKKQNENLGIKEYT